MRVLRNNIILKKKINFSGCKLCRDQQERQVYLGNSGTVLPQYGINQFGRLIILPDNVLTWTSCTLLRRLHMCVLTRVPTTITGYPSTIGSAHLLLNLYHCHFQCLKWIILKSQGVVQLKASVCWLPTYSTRASSAGSSLSL